MVAGTGPTAILESIDIEGFRSCRNTSFSPNAGLSALIGLNGAGKTNLLQAIRLLAPVRERGIRASQMGVLSESGTPHVTAWFRIDGKRIGLKVFFSTVEGGRKGEELVSVQEQWNLNSITGSRSWKRIPPFGLLQAYSNERENTKQSGRFIYSDIDGHYYPKSLASGLDLSILKDPTAIATLMAVHAFRRGITYYSASQFTDPSRCPSSFEVDEERRLIETFLPTGAPAHTRFLHDLYLLKLERPDQYLEYCKFVSKNQLGLISRILWKEVELSSSTAEVRSGGKVQKIKKLKTLIIPKVQVGTSHITFNQLSEGTFKTLALAFYIITNVSKLLMIEEPEVCVHHGLLRKIVQTVLAHSSRKQIIISTHSDLLVDELEPSQVYVVEMGRLGTTVKKLEQWLGSRDRAALHAYLNESGSLGEYWKSGGLS